MNFGDILAQWEKTGNVKTNRNSSGKEWRNKKANAGFDESTTAEKKQKPEINPMELWLRRHTVTDKDAISEKLAQQEKGLDREMLHKKSPDASIDLHGLTQEEAWSRLDSFVTECVKRKLKKILIIHGKGNHSAELPVLMNMVRSFIECDPRLGESGHPGAKDGGRGATWVLLKY
jgi:DNA-nicking Smr family endonuclease